MSAYPTRPQSPNGWQILGNLATQGGQIVGQFSEAQTAEEDRKNRLAALMQDMADKKTAAEMLKVKAAREAAGETRKAAESERMKTAVTDFQTFAKGKEQASQPAQSTPYLAPGLGPNGEASMDIPAVTQMVRPDRAALQQRALETGAYADPGVKAYMDDTKPITALSLEDRLALIQAQSAAANGKPLTPYQKAMLGLAQDNAADRSVTRELARSDKAFTQEQKLQEKFLTQTKDFRDVRDAYGRIQVSAKDPSPAGDLALIFNYMKMLDPGSTVREGEFASAAASGSYGDRIQAAASKLVNGQRLSPDQRTDFLARAKTLYAQQAQQAKKTESETKKQAEGYGLNPSRAVTDLGLADGVRPTYKEYDSLPRGTEYTDPNGNVRRKK